MRLLEKLSTNPRLSDWLSAGVDPAACDPATLRELRALNTMLLTAVALCPSLGLFWSSVATPAFGVLYALAMVSWIGLFALLRATKRTEFVGRAACVVLWLLCTASSVLLGGPDSYALAWVMVMPVAAAAVVGRQDLYAWSVISVLSVFGISGAAWLGVEFPKTAVASLNSPVSIISLAMGVVVVAVLTAVWNDFQSALERRLDASVAQLRREIETKKLLLELANLASEAMGTVDAVKSLLPPVKAALRLRSLLYWEVDARRSGEAALCCVSEEPTGEAPASIVVEALESAAMQSQCASEGFSVAVPVLRGEGVVGVLEAQSEGPRDERGQGAEVTGLLVQLAHHLAQIEERSRAALALWEESRRDHVTHLSNRRAFQELLEGVLDDADRDGRVVALLFIDLNGFKRVNDSLGHSAGDDLLRLVARRLCRLVRLSDLLCTQPSHPSSGVSRIGGDEFTLILDEIRSAEDAEQVAERLLDGLCAPAQVRGEQVRIGASIGIAVYPDDARDADRLIRCADTAMSKVKERGSSGLQRYVLDESAVDELAFERELHAALEQSHMSLHYQPVFHCESGRLVGAEALLRWRDPQKGSISPAEFIPIAERLGLMRDVGYFQLEEAFAWLEASLEQVPDDFRLALNVSPTQLEDGDFSARLASLLSRASFGPERLEVEITETALLLDTPETREHIRGLADLGLRVALDDFGTGQSSLSLLKRLPISRLKVDRSFVSGLPESTDDVAIVAAVLSLARNLRVPVVAEGVEDEAQHEFLALHGCDELQGYLLGRPVDGDDFLRLHCPDDVS